VTQLGLLPRRPLIRKRASRLILYVSVCTTLLLCLGAPNQFAELNRLFNPVRVCSDWPLGNHLGHVSAFDRTVIPLRSLLLEVSYLLLEQVVVICRHN